jgi:thymidylate synthase
MNVCHALHQGMMYLKENGTIEESRAGRVIVAPGPVTTVYQNPTQRVLFSAKRDANPFFHLMESMWMFAGRQDAEFLNQYIRDFGSRFAEPDGRIHDAYGYRWREHFSFMDQLRVITKILRKDPGSRQAVLTMWDPVADLGVPNLKTRPCNVTAFFQVPDGLLNMTVCCRSNDIIFGAYGANAVHFSLLQEYMAATLNVDVGRYWQVSNNYHAYLDVFDLYDGSDLGDNRYPMTTQPLVDNPDTFIQEVTALLEGKLPVFQNRFLSDTVWPMMHNFKARQILHPVAAKDWEMAGNEWIMRRKKK